MARNNPSQDLFGMDDFIAQDPDKADGVFMANEDASQPFAAGASAWQFQSTPPYDSYDLSSTAPPTDPTYAAPSWQLRNYDQQAVAAGIASLPSANVNPASLFAGSVPSADSRRHNTNHLTRPITTLTPAVQEQLRNIAMPPHLQYNSPKSASSPDSAIGDGKLATSTSPDVADSTANARKRKISAEMEEDEEEDEDGKPVKKTAHNMIEKRYRTNLNDKIAALRDSVPSLRIMSKSARGEDTTEDREELHGLAPAHKLNKATVLSKATEYIRHLEKRNGRLLEENSAMQARIAAFEKLFLAGAMNGSISPMQQPSTPLHYSQPENQQSFLSSPVGAAQDGSNSPTGMIQVPEDMKRIISAQMAVGQPYPVPQQPFRGGNPALIRQQQIQQHQQMQQSRWNNAAPYFGKLMVGSLAGLMILEAFREDEISQDKPEGRGLFALPIQVLGQLASGLDFHVLGYHFRGSLKAILLLGTCLWIFMPSLFAPYTAKYDKLQAGPLQPAPSLASSIHVRRQAWLTAIQTVWVPRHNFFLEAAALMLKTAKLSLRNTIGVHGYQVLTGLTEEQETARVKAWSIALDSQLAGGDIEINRSRLVLTLLASGTLPDSPIRLMLKALHIRILLWDLQNGLPIDTVNAIASKIAGSKWNEARRLNQLLVRRREADAAPHEDELPEHLAVLVQQECDDVLNPDVIQRAHNLAFNMETTHEIVGPIDRMDSVVDDTAIGSPMDAVAAWCSTQTLHRVLASTLNKDEDPLEQRVADLEKAMRMAPIGSTAKLRAILAHAVLVDRKRGTHIALAIQAMKTEGTDPLLALQCAKSIAHLRRIQSTAGTPHEGIRLIQQIAIPGPQMSLLGCTAVMELVERMLEHKAAAETFQSSLERLVGSLRLWIGGPAGDACGLDTHVQHKVVDRCLSITKSLVGMELDTGYGSLDEDDGETC
ncbi:hypothetical protein S7711_05237 [Stachybotrys chartarum IBT 7711]|uniref:BHLH domain-containing protein n=1 Tax=Stachybotrys chartarum (strain CBS 109288 / IBT 7711) TaxID=1280523 RepID=A0A084ANK4_STACB|nr:hypothetical protein S7711_05237 [Stachybotrys chartarum IBT 7711]